MSSKKEKAMDCGGELGGTIEPRIVPRLFTRVEVPISWRQLLCAFEILNWLSLLRQLHGHVSFLNLPVDGPGKLLPFAVVSPSFFDQFRSQISIYVDIGPSVSRAYFAFLDFVCFSCGASLINGYLAICI